TTPQPGLTELPAIELLSFERIEVKPEPLQKATAALGLGDGLATVREGRGSRFVLRLRTEDGREIELRGRAAPTTAREAPAGPESSAGCQSSAGRHRRRAETTRAYPAVMIGLLCLDLGTTSAKAALIDLGGRTIVSTSAEYP